ncbi:MAG: type II secretion system minor pseudopilin GspI [Methylomonas sp.]|nr:type II secretion system minor pseudopilin GspI [Methylomonas sp.]PPD24757.1 MAG: type II secretion system protein GspI [Methylomonas sp.]PPD33358.1 MAG: type II secretion system protein GspI [Methylomonas sp.]
MTPRSAHGFTLLEVLIALAILAILMTGLIQVAAHNTQNLRYLENSLIAEQIAHNQWLAFGLNDDHPEQADGWDTMAGRKWYWQIGRQSGGMPGVTTYRIKVFLEGEASPYIDFPGYLPNAA